MISRRGRWILIAAVATASLAAAVFVGVSCRASQSKILLGRSLYAQHCASCHGIKLEGEPDWQTPRPNGRMPAPPHDASGHTWHHSDDELFTITKKGLGAVVPGHESDMPTFESILSDDEIRTILAFIKSTWPERERDYQAARSGSR